MNNIKVSELKIVFNRIIGKFESQFDVDRKIELQTSIYQLIPTDK
tara:strand:- start:734 stop:868 length:135 start_codon:yes stop_codon:yes gene_type:complete